MRKLKANEREFCRLVAQASLANPHGEFRLALDKAIGGEGPTPARHDIFHQAASGVRRFVEGLEAAGALNLGDYEGEDRYLLEFTLLFDIFHQLMDAFDEHILQQVASPETALKVPFADRALHLFDRRGFDRASALRYFAIFFQGRRAFFFIDQQITGSCACMAKLKQDLWQALFTHDTLYFMTRLMDQMEDFSTLLLGETGTGKGTAAAALGRSCFIPFRPASQTFAASFASAFLAINLSQYPPGLIESELFGHEKGAFTGAIQRHDGVFARCSPFGSIFLDEIGEVSIPIQIKLLDVLQTRTFRPVGSRSEKRFNGRLIAATNQDITALRREGTFRDDLYYRLCSDVITVPPLRQRVAEDPEELRALVHHRLAAVVGREEPEKAEEIHSLILTQLGPDYPWPGNVRELEQCIRRILIRKEYKGEPHDDAPQRAQGLGERIVAGQLTASDMMAEYCRLLHEELGTLGRVARVAGLNWRTVKKHLQDGVVR